MRDDWILVKDPDTDQLLWFEAEIHSDVTAWAYKGCGDWTHPGGAKVVRQFGSYKSYNPAGRWVGDHDVLECAMHNALRG